MSVPYRIIERKNMSKDADPDSTLFYASSFSNGVFTIDQMYEAIADRSTATAGDVKLILDGLMVITRRELANGKSIQLGEIGYLTATLDSRGAETEKEFTPDHIRRKRITFRPGKLLRETAAKLKVQRVNPVVKTVDAICDLPHAI